MNCKHLKATELLEGSGLSRPSFSMYTHTRYRCGLPLGGRDDEARSGWVRAWGRRPATTTRLRRLSCHYDCDYDCDYGYGHGYGYGYDYDYCTRTYHSRRGAGRSTRRNPRGHGSVGLNADMAPNSAGPLIRSLPLPSPAVYCAVCVRKRGCCCCCCPPTPSLDTPPSNDSHHAQPGHCACCP